MDSARKNVEEAMTATAENPWVSINKAARTLGIHKSTIRSLALRGVLRFTTVDDRIFVHGADVDTYLARRDAETSE
jgi:excisionase family DNA binding protein